MGSNANANVNPKEQEEHWQQLQQLQALQELQQQVSDPDEQQHGGNDVMKELYGVDSIPDI